MGYDKHSKTVNGIYKQHHNYHFEWAKEEQK